VKQRIGRTPYVVKIGHVSDEHAARGLLESLNGIADGLAMTNSIAARVFSPQIGRLFDGELRGVCGAAIRAESIEQVARFAKLIAAADCRLSIVGVGGVSSAQDVLRYCDAGAGAVQIATAAMLRPAVGLEIRRTLAEEFSTGFLRPTYRVNNMEA
jgi:dihydroorotate dehydrogenase